MMKWDQLLGSVSLFEIHAKLGSSSGAHHLRYYRGVFRVAWAKVVVAKETETGIFLWNFWQDSYTRFQSAIYVVKRRSHVESLADRNLAVWLTKRYSITFRVFSSNAFDCGGSLHGQVFFPMFSAWEQSVEISISCHVSSSPIKLDTNEVTMNIITQTTESEKVTFGYWVTAGHGSESLIKSRASAKLGFCGGSKIGESGLKPFRQPTIKLNHIYKRRWTIHRGLPAFDFVKKVRLL